MILKLILDMNAVIQYLVMQQEVEHLLQKIE